MIGSSLKRLRKVTGCTQLEMATKLGVSSSIYNDYELDKKDPRPDGLLHICEVLNTTPNFLYGISSERGEFVKPIPILGIIRAGLPLLAEENYSESITVGQFEKGADFALRVTGDSMIYAGIRQGDIVLMQQADRAASGQIVAATVQDMDCMATLKYFVDGKAPVLRAANPKYADQPITSNHRIIGVFSGLVRTNEPSIHEYENLVARADDLNDDWKEAMNKASALGWSAEGVLNLLEIMNTVKK